MSTSATALSRRSTLASVPTTSTSKPGTPRSRISSSVWVTPCMPPTASATSATRSGSPSRWTSLPFSRPRKAAAGAYGMAATQASKRPAAAAPRSPPRGRGGQDAVDRAGELALVRAAGAAEEVGVAEVLVLQQREQVALVEAQVDGLQPGVQQAARVVGAEVGADRAAPHVSFAHDALDHGQHRARVDRSALAAPQGADGERHRAVRPFGAALAAPQRADGQRHRAVRPLGGAGASPAADARSHGWPTERSCGGGAGAGRPPAGPT